MKRQSKKSSQKQSAQGGVHIPTAACTSARACAASPALDDGDGGQTSISPPVKVKVLTSGVDTMYLTFDVDWSRSTFPAYLSELKDKAIKEDQPQPGHVVDWLFQVQPYGRRGYEWLLEGQEYLMRVGSWERPKKTKPSVIVEIRSETLWRLGVVKAVDRIIMLLNYTAGYDLDYFPVKSIKLSRLDLCLDLLLPSHVWSLDILENIVCRAKNITPYLKNGQLGTITGLRIGGSKMHACMYDKALEIKTKSTKEWMFDLWRLNEVPVGFKVIRVEFRMLREVLKEFNLDKPEDLLCCAPNLWSYCTNEWLKFQDRPGTHHTQRKTLDWWGVVQNGFEGAQGAKPLVRNKAIQGNQLQFIRQVYGLMTSLTALQQEKSGQGIEEMADFNDCLSSLFEAFSLLNKDRDFSDDVFMKRTRLNRLMQRQVTVNLDPDEFDKMLMQSKGGHHAN